MINAIRKKSFFSQDQVIFILTAEEHEHQLRLDQFLAFHFKTTSRQKIKEKIKKSEVIIKGRTPPHRPSTKVHFQDEVTVTTHNLEQDETQLEVIHEDQDILIVNKPPQMIVHPTGKHLFNCVTSILEKQRGHPIHSIHRIDQETSGLLILGKNPQGSTHYSLIFENRNIKKCYFFIAHKYKKLNFPLKADQNLAADQELRKRLFVRAYPNGKTGKTALTEFHCLMENEKFLAGLAFPHTGRQHQIRAHAYHHGFPLVGDKIYRHDQSLFDRYKSNQLTNQDHQELILNRHALHAYALYSNDFKTHSKYFLAPLTEDLQSFVEKEFQMINLNEKIKEIILHQWSIS